MTENLPQIFSIPNIHTCHNMVSTLPTMQCKILHSQLPHLSSDCTLECPFLAPSIFFILLINAILQKDVIEMSVQQTGKQTNRNKTSFLVNVKNKTTQHSYMNKSAFHDPPLGLATRSGEAAPASLLSLYFLFVFVLSFYWPAVQSEDNQSQRARPACV